MPWSSFEPEYHDHRSHYSNMQNHNIANLIYPNIDPQQYQIITNQEEETDLKTKESRFVLKQSNQLTKSFSCTYTGKH